MQPCVHSRLELAKHTDTSGVAFCRAMPISHECWSFCHRCYASDIEVSHHVTADRKKIIIGLGATMDVLVQQAKGNRTVVMRMAETKGTMYFHEDLIQYYSVNHGGLNECVEENLQTKWLPRKGEKTARDWTYRPPKDPSGRAPWEDFNDRSMKVFTSAQAQALVMDRLKTHASLDPEHHKNCSDRNTLMKALKSRAARQKPRKITSEMCHDLLLAHGGFRPHSRDVFPKVQGSPVVTLLAAACHKDSMWTLHPDGHVQTNVLAADELPSYSLIIDVLRVLEAWTDTIGREEQFIGTLKDFFPVQNEGELAYLKRDWGRFGILLRREIVGFTPESELRLKVVAGEVQTANEQFENNTFGSEANYPSRFTWPALLFFQPLEEIHDYFGDDVGLYFAWLDKYTHALFLMSFYGTFVMAKQLLYHEGPDDNPLTLLYSIYVGAWSILFLQAWNRRETELRFLWGLERLKSLDHVRREFKHGSNVALDINPDTGRQTFVVKNAATQLIHKLISTICVVFMMVFAMLSATMAILVRYIGEGVIDKEDDVFTAHGSNSDDLPESDHATHYKYNQKSELFSAFLGLFIIIVCGMIFDGVATKLNHYENHRTQAEYDDALILKTFAFQFLNNYWALIYIAYFREVPDPFFGEVHPCEKGSCMFELQFQLLVVFSFKTVGKQIGFTVRPFIYKAIKLVLANRQLKKALDFSEDIAKSSIKKIPGGESAIVVAAQAQGLAGGLVDAAVGEDIPEQHVTGLHPHEVQAELMTYSGTFYDFNDRTVQFGYIVLFAPAFPLAPLLAFINNIVEIRAAGYKLCHGYRRPVVKHRPGIGTWSVVLNSLGFMAVIMNSTMINFVGRQNARSFGVPDTPGHWEDNSTIMYNDDLAGGYGARLENNSGLLGRMNVAALWLRFFVVEHCSMAVRLLVLFLTPNLPSWIKTARETLEFREQTVYQTYEALETKRQYREKYEEKLTSHMDDMKEHLEAAMHSESLAAIFDRIDVDGSGALQHSVD